MTPPSPTDTGTAWSRAQDLLATEWIKLRSLRSTYVIGLAGLIATLVINALTAHTAAKGYGQWTPTERANFDAVREPFRSFSLAQLAFTVTGVLVISSEYSSGLIRTTFTATPTRTAVLAAKAGALGLAAFVSGTVTATASFLVTQAVYATAHFGAPITAPGAIQGIGATAAYLTALALLGLAIGTLLRHTAAAITGAVVILLLLPQFIHGDSGLMLRLHQILPDTAMRRLITVRPDELAPSLTTAWAAIVLIPAAALALAAVVIHRRDA